VLFYGGNQVERFPLSGLTYDTKARRLFVGDYQNNRVMVFDVATSTITNGENAVSPSIWHKSPNRPKFLGAPRILDFVPFPFKPRSWQMPDAHERATAPTHPRVPAWTPFLQF
jgi:hypothetical protein